MIGSNLSHYKVLEELSRGGMGIVYLALDLKLDREVALKVLPPELIADPERKRRFILEAKAAARLNHPHIGTIFEIDEDEGVTFIAMELIRGEKLKDIVNREKLPLTRALALAVEVAEGLARAHDKGIVHRDLKPANIMVTEDGHAKIIDFGLAKLVEPMSGEGSEVETAIRGDTEPGKVMGTLSYMSPEQARGATVDHRTDIFSFGIVLYDMLTGEPPFKAPSGPEILAAIINAPTPQLESSVSGDGVPDCQRILDKCLAKNPDHRCQTMKDLVVDLRALHRRLESGAVSPLSDPSPSIAVLPFADMSPGKDQDYFCEGMAEEIINALTKIEGLRVAARTSTFQFKDKAEDIGRIGEALKVKTLLEGSVRTAGNRLRVTAQLINVEDGYHLWSERYDREMEDVFAIQDDITSRIAEALKVQLLTSDESPRTRAPTQNLEAYHLYLTAQHYRLSRFDFAKARQFFEQAIVEEPSHALAYAGLADCYSHLGFYGIIPPDVARSKAKEAAEKALSLDSGLGQAHASFGQILNLLFWEWSDAERSFNRAIELDPTYAITYARYALLLANLGRHAEVTALIRRAEQLEPLCPMITSVSGALHGLEGNYESSIAIYRRALEIHPDHPALNLFLSFSSALAGRPEDALSILRKYFPPNSPSFSLGTLGFAHAAALQKDQALEIAKELEEKGKQQYVSPLLLAWIYGALGRKEVAFRWLETAYEERTPFLALLKYTKSIFHPSLRSDPRFDDLARRMRLPI